LRQACQAFGNKADDSFDRAANGHTVLHGCRDCELSGANVSCAEV
jgi:hypothetical protein